MFVLPFHFRPRVLNLVFIENFCYYFTPDKYYYGVALSFMIRRGLPPPKKE